MALLDFLKPQADRYPPVEIVEHANPNKAAWELSVLSGGQLYRIAPTGSMRPTLMDDDYVVTQKVPYEELKEGDIISYTPKWNKGKLTIHRLVQKDKTGWIASGDNNARSESWERVTPSNYVDKLVKVYRKPKEKKP